MNLMLKIIGPDGEVTELPIDDARLEITAVPGHSYRLTGEATQPPPQSTDKPAPRPNGPRVLRIDDDLLLDQIEGGYPVTLSGFFANCAQGESCELIVEIEGQESVTLTPASEPLAAYAEGGFLMYVNEAPETIAQSIPKAPEAEVQFDWRPWAAVGGGLLLVAGAAGGSGSAVGNDSTPPGAPTIDSGTQTNSPMPVFSGTADAGSTVKLVVQVGEGASAATANYSTQADEQGNWSVDTSTATPTSGQFPALGIQDGQSANVSLVATDTSGNLSAVVSSAVEFDATPPARPVISADGDLKPGADGLVTVNAADLADGIQINGAAEAGSTVNVSLSGAAYTFAEQVQADANGAFSVIVPVDQAPADASDLSLSVTASDPAGNVSTAAQTDIAIDTSVSGARVTVTLVTDNTQPQTGTVDNGITNDATPTVRGIIAGELDEGETIQVLRDGDLIGTAQVATNNIRWAFTDDLTDVAGGPEGEYNYQVRVTDLAGNMGLVSDALALTVDQTNPVQTVAIDTVIDDTAARPITISSGGLTDDQTPTLRLSLSDVLGDDESLHILRSQEGQISVVAELTAQDATNGVFVFEDSVGSAPGTIGYQAQVVDTAGLAGVASSVYAIRLIAPIDVQA